MEVEGDDSWWMRAVQRTQEDKLVCGPVYLFSWITFISVIMFFFPLCYLSQHVLSVYTSMRVDMKKKKRSALVLVSGNSTKVTVLQSIMSWIENVVPIFTRVFERKTSIKMAIFFTCSISFCRLCWDIPGAPWQSRMWWFPFQTGLSCPSHHQGSLPKYIPSVRARG